MRGRVQIKVPTENVGLSPTGANFFQLAHLGGFVQLTVMYLDVGKLSEVISPEKPHTAASPVFEPEVVGRFVMSVEGLALLQRQTNELAKKLHVERMNVQAHGITPDVTE